ncbi:hypothetical protein AYX07_13145 [Thermoactinomyces sp. AS95]|jgi:hypothetical protein|nr:hypothetical protein AYX07_13145 [Thermoactinomyces sp. AS95]
MSEFEMNSSLAEKITKLNEEGVHKEEIERFLDQHLIKYPDDVEAWVRLGVLVFEPPIGDFEKSINCLRKAVEVKPDCLEALLILMRMQNYIYREIDEDLYKLLHKKSKRKSQITFFKRNVKEKKKPG